LLGEQWGEQAACGWVIGLCGELGAGKTQLVKGIATGLGFQGRVNSPTYTLVHEYIGGRLPLYHLDWYRLASVDEIMGSGLETYLPSDGLTVVEWADRWQDIAARPYRLVQIAEIGLHERRIRYEDFVT